MENVSHIILSEIDYNLCTFENWNGNLKLQIGLLKFSTKVHSSFWNSQQDKQITQNRNDLKRTKNIFKI